MSITSILKSSRPTRLHICGFSLTELRKSDLRDNVRSSGGLGQKVLMDDIRQIAFVNPSCVDHPASSAVTTDCSVLKIRGGVIPVPDATVDTLDALASSEADGKNRREHSIQ